MARTPEGWRIRKEKGRETYTVRFTHNGRRVERSTGCTDPEEAAKAAARVYADFVQREPVRRRTVRRGDSPPLAELVALWLAADSTISPRTVPIWTIYGGHWCAKWESLVHVTEATCEEYRNERLRVVLATTVRKELGALRRFLAWCRAHGYLHRDVNVPFVPQKATGKRFEKRRRVSAPELSPEQIEAILAELPEWSRSRKRDVPPFPIRARFIVAYETGLRPSFLDVMSVPEHYTRGARSIRIWAEHDKNRLQRDVPLTARARAALDAVCPRSGLVFGRHDYRPALRAAARKALPRTVATAFCGAHFRSAAATHVLEATGNIPGVMHLFGWVQVGTATKYTRASKRAAEDTVRALEQFRGQCSDSGGTARSKAG